MQEHRSRKHTVLQHQRSFGYNNLPSIYFLFLEGMLLVALHPRCSASGDFSLFLSELIMLTKEH